MRIFTDLIEWRTFRQTLPPGKSLGFAPTMGNLHYGHAVLFKTCSQENDSTASTLFVNPTQFNCPHDFAQYPKTLEADMALMEQSGVDYCILPEEKAMYPDGYAFQIHEHVLSKPLEGQHRPGHFHGMLTVVMKLLQLVQASTAYFGEKDYQQFLLIEAMAAAFFLPTAIKVCPTVREPSGLAYSSRNNRLNPEQKQLAHAFATLFHQEKDVVRVREKLDAMGIAVDYIEDYQQRRYAAVRIGDVRLIDNYFLKP